MPTRQADGKGVLISKVHPDSPADRSGLEEGDIIVKVNDDPAENIGDVLHCLEEHAPGSACQFTVLRQGATKQVSVEVGDVSTAPSDWLLNAYRAPRDIGDEIMIPSGALEQEVRQLRMMVERLRQDVAELQGQRRTSTPKDRSDQPRSSGIPSDAGGSIRLPSTAEYVVFKLNDGMLSASDPSAALVASPGSVQERGRRARQNQRNWYWNNYPYRYGYNDYWWGNVPRYNTWYYGYDGNQWYRDGYGWNDNYYGPRYGIRVGRNWGVYWY
jgi:hypothetical protein